MATRELLGVLDLKRARVELHRRLSVPWAHLIVVLWGIPLMIRAGTRNPVIGAGLALAAGIAFYGSSFLGAGLAEETALPAALGLWAPPLVFTIAGSVLYARMD